MFQLLVLIVDVDWIFDFDPLSLSNPALKTLTNALEPGIFRITMEQCGVSRIIRKY